jgi:hypothetical protein
MGYHLKTFASWLRGDMSFSDDIEILIDRAAIPKDRKRRPSTRWDHLAKQQSFSMPKVPCRRRIKEDTVTERSPPSRRVIKQNSFDDPPMGGTGRRPIGDGDEVTTRFGMTKQTSLRCLSRHTAFNALSEVERMKMPRLVKQKPYSSSQIGRMPASATLILGQRR